MRLDGQITLTTATELQKLLIEWLDSGKNLELDLERADEIDVAILQLLWAAGNETACAGASIISRASQTVLDSVRCSAFDQTPGFPVRE